MNWTSMLAIYGAIVSSALAGISIFEFVKRQKIFLVRHNCYFSGEECRYVFIVSNISSSETVITDCMIASLSYVKGEGNMPDWGMMPHVAKTSFDESPPKKLDLPLTLRSGQAVILCVDSEEIMGRFNFSSSLEFKNQDWLPTDKMMLEIEHSRSAEAFTYNFGLERDERIRAQLGAAPVT